MKPVKQSELFDAIVAAVVPRNGCAARVALRRGCRLRVRSKRLRILLAEDSLVNQKLAVGLLERQGHRLCVANNGREARSCARGATV